MSDLNNKTSTTRKASQGALKAVYFVVIGLAIREALNRAFLDGNAFIGRSLFDDHHLSTTLLFFAFLPTAVRFVHGASIHIDALSDKRYKPLIDFAGFIVQAALFYLMAITLHSSTDFVWLLASLFVFDALWLVALHVTKYHLVGGIERQWLISDIAMVGLLVGVLLCGGGEASQAGSWVIVAAATAATILDYWCNREFYFPV